MKKLLLISVMLLSFMAEAQFVNYGILGGVGFGGLKGKDMTIKSGANPEFGFFFKYNYTEKISFRTFITIDLHKTTLQKGREVTDVGTSPYTIGDAPDYAFHHSGATQHVDISYIVKENVFDISAGVFWGAKIVHFFDPYNASRAFYTTDEEINSIPYGETWESSETTLYTNDQIQEGLHGLNGGIYFAATAGPEAFKIMLRYDMYMNNYYSKYSTTNKLHESYVRAGLIVMLNR